jgi:hypothetical protein
MCHFLHRSCGNRLSFFLRNEKLRRRFASLSPCFVSLLEENSWQLSGWTRAIFQSVLIDERRWCKRGHLLVNKSTTAGAALFLVYKFFSPSFFHFHFLACHRHTALAWNIARARGDKKSIVSECRALHSHGWSQRILTGWLEKRGDERCVPRSCSDN